MDLPIAVGDTIAGRYRIERVLGRGGMGIVVAARHVHLGEAVAIKIPFARALMGRDLTARILREGRAAARLRGEHIARVMDVGTLDSGEPFIVFELLRGSDLETALETRGPLPLGEALEYVLQACEGLAEAHALGFVHRDLKPANLFLTKRPDGSPSIKIIDFGIAKAADPAEGGAATESFMIFGTPLYMSPEQMRSSRDVDARSDIWSLGAVLHHLLAGQPPFPPKSLPEIYQLTQAGPPKIRTLREDVPAAVEAALLRCMSQSPADRFANVADLAEALAALAPPQAAVCAERARRILLATDAETEERAGSITPNVDPNAPTGDVNAPSVRAPLVSDPADEAVVSAPTLAAGKASDAATAEAEAAARSIVAPPAHETIGAVRIDVASREASPSQRRSPLVIAIAAALACVTAALLAWVLSGPHGDAGPHTASTVVTGLPATNEPSAVAASPGPSQGGAIVTPKSALPDDPSTATAATATVASASAASSAKPPGTTAATVPASAHPRSTASAAAPARTAKPHAGPLDDPN